MLQERNRKLVIITFIVGLVFILASVAASWSAFVGEEENRNFGALPLIYSIIAVGSVSYLFRLALNLSDTKAFNNYLDLKVSEARTTLTLEELREEEEKNKESETEVDDSAEKAKEIIPTGNIKNIETIGKKLLVNLANAINLMQGIFYISNDNGEEFTFCVGYALQDDRPVVSFMLGEGLNGESAKNQEIIVINEIPEHYFRIESGLGQSPPGHLYIVPIVFDKKTIAVIELASFIEIGDKNMKILEQASELISKKIKQLVKP